MTNLAPYSFVTLLASFFFPLSFFLFLLFPLSFNSQIQLWGSFIFLWSDGILPGKYNWGHFLQFYPMGRGPGALTLSGQSWGPDNYFLEAWVTSLWSFRITAEKTVHVSQRAAEPPISLPTGPAGHGPPLADPQKSSSRQTERLSSSPAWPPRPLQLSQCCGPKVQPLLFVDPPRIPVCVSVKWNQRH